MEEQGGSAVQQELLTRKLAQLRREADYAIHAEPRAPYIPGDHLRRYLAAHEQLCALDRAIRAMKRGTAPPPREPCA